MEEYKNSIRSISNKITNKNINLEEIDIIYHSNDNKNPIYKFVINGQIINRKNKYVITYKCLECNREKTISLNSFINKINKNIKKCDICQELESTKKYTCQDIINKSEEEFKNYGEIFEERYFKKHLMLDEFNHLKSKIISIQNDRIIDINNYIYYPHNKYNKQIKFVPKIYDYQKDIFEDINYIKFRCEKCDSNFINKDLCPQKNKLKIYCPDCNSNNKTIKIKNFKNIKDEKIEYQSRLEFKFINFCNSNNILIQNGPKINYEHNGLQRNYKVNFYLPELNYLVGFNENHHWHKRKLNNDIWDSRKNKIQELIDNYIYTKFILIFPKKYQQTTNSILLYKKVL